MILVSCREFVLKQMGSISGCDSSPSKTIPIKNYANLLSRPLTLGMFTACDLKGNVLTKPKLPSIPYEAISIPIRKRYEAYKEAEDRILFKDCNVELTPDSRIFKITIFRKNEDPVRLDSFKNEIVESLVDRKFTLTLSAQKQMYPWS